MINNVTQRRVIAAAVRIDESIYVGVRHYDPIMTSQLPSNTAYIEEEGFIDNKGNFLNRKEAMDLVKQSGQPFDTSRNGCEDILYSEGIC